MVCECCEKKHDGSYGSGRFCCIKCARSFSTDKDKNNTKNSFCTNCNKKVLVRKRTSDRHVFCEQCRENKKTTYICKECNENFRRMHKRIFCSKKCKNLNKEYLAKLSEKCKQRKFGGHTSKKTFYYKCKDGNIVYLQSSFENEVAKNLDENNISWIRPDPFKWIDVKKEYHWYYPDFYLPEFNVYLDPKNDYLIRKDKDKINRVSVQNSIEVVILSKENLKWDQIKNIIAG